LNQGISNKFKFPDTVNAIKIDSLEWLGHVVRMAGQMAVHPRLPKNNTGTH
jgi:hypothetical protein